MARASSRGANWGWKAREQPRHPRAVVKLCLWRAAQGSPPFDLIGLDGRNQGRCREVLQDTTHGIVPLSAQPGIVAHIGLRPPPSSSPLSKDSSRHAQRVQRTMTGVAIRPGRLQAMLGRRAVITCSSTIPVIVCDLCSHLPPCLEARSQVVFTLSREPPTATKKKATTATETQ
jgi:hypothetical protein